MSRNGSGVYSLPGGSTVTNGDTSDATDLNTPIADIAADLNIARPIVAGGTGSTSASAARTALGLAIGTNVQAYDAALTSVAALGTAADKGVYFTGIDTAAEFDLTAAGRALLDDASATAQRTTLGLGDIATTDLIDEDSFATNSATRAPSQQSVKAYTAAQIAASSPVIARITLNQATDTIIQSSGVASIANEATGRTRITFSDTQPDNKYQVICTTTGSGGDVTALWSNTANFGAAANKTTTYFDIYSTTGGGSATNSEYVCVLVFGD